jgi:hypothetical protein
MTEVETQAAVLAALQGAHGALLEQLADLPLESWGARGLGMTGEVAGLRGQLREVRGTLGSVRTRVEGLRHEVAELTSWHLWWGRNERHALDEAAALLMLPVAVAGQLRRIRATWERLVPVLHASGAPPAMTPAWVDPDDLRAGQAGPPARTSFNPFTWGREA